MKKRILSSVLALSMLLSLLPVTALAAEEDVPAEGGEAAVVETTVVEETYIPDPDDLPDNDELFAGYVEQTMYADLYGGISMFSTGIHTAGSQLTGLDAKIYSGLKAKIADVASGALSSTQFTLTWEELGVQTTWTKAELGVDTLLVLNAETGNYEFTQDAQDAIAAKIAFNWSAILNSLLADFPCELYWYDKTMSTGYSGGGYSGDSSSITLTGNLTFSFPVSQDYAVTDGSSYQLYQADTTKTGAAAAAVTSANAVVTANKGKSDYEKLVAYKNYICEQVSYNSTAAGTPSYPYGDPWQLIYVFDGNSSTNVVCEGYAKAFQYLCDLTTFNNSTIQCYTVTGTMTGGTGAGSHMWNIVTMEDGKNYLVDVTNCDTGTVGNPDKLFLAGTSNKSSGDYDYKWTIDASNWVSYKYDADQAELFGSGVLVLADSNYTPPTPSLSTATVTLGTTTYTYDGTEKKPGVTVKMGETTLTEGTHYTVSYANNTNAGTNTASVTVTAVAEGGYTGSKTVNFTINPKPITASIAGTATKTYDRTTACDGTGLTLSLDGKIGSDDVTATATYTYDSANVGTGKTITASGISLSGDKSGNYTLSSTPVTTSAASPPRASRSPLAALLIRRIPAARSPLR